MIELASWVMYGREKQINCHLHGGFLAQAFIEAVEQRQRAERFVDDGANYQNANHNVTKMETIKAVVI